MPAVLLAACALAMTAAMAAVMPSAWARMDQAERAAAVPDETGKVSPPLPPPYGPVLTPRAATPAAAGAMRHPPADVRDETDVGRAPPPEAAAAQPLPGKPPASAAQTQPSRRRPARRSAWQVAEPAPSAAAVGAAAQVKPVPLTVPPQPVVPSSTISGPCQGSLCTDASGNTTTGSGPAAIGNGGRLCVRGTATVQCF